MAPAIAAAREAGALAEAAICYTGDILDPSREKYSLGYYVRHAKELERMGTHILGIKDMAGLLRPYAAYKLIKTLREEVGIPIHLHTHDTSGINAATILKAAEAGVNAADAAISAMSGTTSQPNLNSIVAALAHTGRDTGLNFDALNRSDAEALTSLFDEDGVFIGPHVCFTNDLAPRAITPDGRLKSADDWTITPTLVQYGASIGAGAVIVCGITIGTFALVGAGAVVARDVPPHALVFGNPARLHGYVCRCSRRLNDVHEVDGYLVGWCETCQQECHFPKHALKP